LIGVKRGEGIPTIIEGDYQAKKRESNKGKRENERLSQNVANRTYQRFFRRGMLKRKSAVESFDLTGGQKILNKGPSHLSSVRRKEYQTYIENKK